jgi:amidase
MGGVLTSWSAVEIARAIREREVSAREVVQAHLERIDECNPKVRAVTSVLADEGLAAADAADAAVARGEELGPLHGVPMTVKENVDVAGSATTQGVTALARAVPPVDAPHVAQLRRAGAIAIGRTNLPDFGLRWHTENGLHGATRNPWDASRTPGGSSGGDAAALATGMTPLGNGNDYGGSLRVPSQFCGTAAIRPTLGRVAQHDALAPSEPTMTLQLFAVQGPMARCVRDLRVALAAMSDRDGRDPWWTPAPLAGESEASAVPVAVVACPPGGGVHPDVEAGVRRAADALADAGYRVEEVEPPGVLEAAELWSSLVFAEIRSALLPFLRPILSREALRFLDLALESAPESDLPRYTAGLAARQGIARRWSVFQERTPLVLGPVCTEPPFHVGRDLESAASVREILLSMRMVVAVNLLGLPAAAVPVGEGGGLPQGVQIIGPRYREDLCLDAAEVIESRLGTLTPIDP